MGQEVCCQISKNTQDELTQQDEDKSETSSVSRESQEQPGEESKPTLNAPAKDKRIQMFYGAKDCAVTKTITKEISLPGLESRIRRMSDVQEEPSQECSRSSTQQEMTTLKIIQQASKKTYETIHNKVVSQI